MTNQPDEIMTGRKIILICLGVMVMISVAQAQKSGNKQDPVQVYVAPNKVFWLSPSSMYKSYSNRIGIDGGLQLNVGEHFAFRVHYNRYNYRPVNDSNHNDKLVMDSFMADLMFPSYMHAPKSNNMGNSIYTLAGAGVVDRVMTTTINTVGSTTHSLKFGLELGFGFSETIFGNLSLFEDIRWVNIYTGKKHTNLFPVQIGIKI